MQFHTDPSDPHALPNAEVFHSSEHNEQAQWQGKWKKSYYLSEGYYWQPRFEDGDPIGPFETEAEAIQNAQEN